MFALFSGYALVAHLPSQTWRLGAHIHRAIELVTSTLGIGDVHLPFNFVAVFSVYFADNAALIIERKHPETLYLFF